MMFLAISYSVKYVGFTIFAYYIITKIGTTVNIIAITRNKHVHIIIVSTTYFLKFKNVYLWEQELSMKLHS